MSRIEIMQGDITKIAVDAIVNAANETLLGGAGVDGAIQRAAGPQLLNECRGLGGCPTGDAKITQGYHLPARHVIHTVGPVWRDGKHQEHNLLQSCYRRSLEVAQANHLKTIAFPCISTGAYRFPKDQAARIAVATVSKCLKQIPEIEKVIFVCFDIKDFKLYEELLLLSEKSTVE